MQAALPDSVSAMRAALCVVACGVASLLQTSEAAVGRVEADYGVTVNGAPAYRIPIKVTDGVGGMTPGLAVSYAGRSSRGIFGVGFTLEGLSSITRCSKTIAQDGVAEAPVMSSTDRYCLGGARLRLVSGTYGATGSTYRTEVDAVVRVTAQASVGNIPGWFRVETPDGRIQEYGNSASSRLMQGVAPYDKPIIWSLNRIADRSGNAITISYDTDQATRRHRPQQIDYTVSNAGAARYRVAFQYQLADRSDPVSGVLPTDVGGGSRVETKLVEKLVLQHDGVPYREYRFAYGGVGSNSRLASIAECVPTDDCVPATTIQWQPPIAGHGAAIARSGIGDAIPLDVNGDGYDDLAWVQGGTWWLSWGGVSGPGAPSNTFATAYSGPPALPLDWNGDGRMDLLVPGANNRWRVLVGSSIGFSASVEAGPGGIPSNTASSEWLVADFNADGRDDLVRMSTSSGVVVRVRLNGSSGFGAETTVLAHPFLRYGAFNARPAGSTPIRKPDFNGDGRTDITFYACEYDAEFGQCAFWGWYYATSSGNSYVVQANVWQSSDANQPNFGDFNADGLTDMVYPNAFLGNWCIAFGQGGGGVAVACNGSTAGMVLFRTVVADYDGDGYDDLYVSSSGASPTWRVVRATGTGLAATAVDTGLAVLNAVPRVGDFNGDDLPDLGASVSSVWSTFPHAGLPGDLLAAAADGLGNTVAFSYLPMSDAAVYAIGAGAVFPVQDHESSAALVRTMSVTPAGSSAYGFEYKYGGARVHLQGRGYLGMASREIKDLRSGVTTTETYEQDFPKTGLLATRTVRQPAPGGQVIESVTNSYTVQNLDTTPNNQRYLPYLSQSVRNDYEVSGPKNGLWITQTTEARTVNSWGNTTAGSTTVVDKDTGSPWYGQSHSASVAATYSENGSSWCLALPTTRVETRTLPGGSTQSRRTHWTVDAAVACRTTQEVVEPYETSDKSLTTDFGYDSCGNVSTVSSYPSGLPAQARTTSVGYGSRCQKPETVTNALVQVTTFGWDYARGVNTTETDPNGLLTQREFDGFGRLTRERGPDLTGMRWSLSECNVGNNYCGQSGDVRLRVTQTARDTADAVLRTDELFLDGEGRVRIAHNASLESGASMVETRYDVYGRVSQRSQPRFAAGALYWTNYGYDLLGRPVQVNAPVSQVQPSGRITAYAYEGRDWKITDPRGYTTTRTSDALGQLRRVIDPSPGGTTSYAYGPFGDLASISDAAGNVTSWTANVRGFVVATSDPDAGSWSYVPDAFGELTSQTDAKGQSVSYTYDKLGRPLTRVEPEGTTTWTWGQVSDNTPTAKYVGHLRSVASPGGYSETNTNDGLGRIVQQQLVIDGASYQINRTYSTTTGWPATLEYPASTAGYRLKLAYDYQNGYLNRVRDANGATVFWTAVSTNPWGRLQNETFGNGVASYTEYDPANGWLFKRQAGLGGGTGLVDAQVTWDWNGNFTTRQDLKQGLTETFVYDPLNRLDYSQRNGVTNLDVTLDAIGNVTGKSDVGSYTYHATKRRAVVTAGGNSYGYDANGNMVTRNGGTIAYASYNLPTSIAAGSNASTLSYGAWRNRSKQVAVTAGVTETTIYVAGLLERVTRGGVTEFRHLIEAPPGTVAVHTRRSSGTNDTYYVHRDHLGSPEMITNASGASLVKLSFSAYGARRDTDWDGPVSAPDLATLGAVSRRGYTDHEHLDGVGLIHMNGRVYDPAVGRSLSRDPYIDGVDSSQGANGYAYVWNNPLTLIDPSGYGYEEIFVDSTHLRPEDTGPRGYGGRGPGMGGGAFGGGGRAEGSGGGAAGSDLPPDMEEIVTTATRLIFMLTTLMPQPWFRFTSSATAGAREGGGGAGGGPQSQEPKQCFRTAEPRSSGEIVSDVIVGFGDAFLIPILVRDLFDISGDIDYGGPAYTGGMIAGTLWGSSTIALRGGAALGGTRAGHALNHNPMVRIGPGRMPASGALPSGTGVPRISFGSRPGGPHGDLRSRLPHLPPVGGLVGGGDGC